MNSKQAKKLFNKYLDNKCSSDELELLETFLDSYQDGKTILSDYNAENIKVSKEVIWKNIISKIEEKPTQSKSYSFNRYSMMVTFPFWASVLFLLIIQIDAGMPVL